MSIQDLREAKAERVSNFNRTMDKYPGNTPIPADVRKNLDQLNREIIGIEDKIEHEEKIMASISDNLNGGRSFGGRGGKTGPSDDQIKALATFCRSGDVSGFGLRNAMTEAGDAGVMVPSEIADEIVRMQEKYSPLRKICKVTTTKTTASKFTQPVITSGLESGWVGELDARPETDAPTIEGVTFPDAEVYCNLPISQWFEDDVNTGKFVMTEIAKSFSKKEGAAFLLGTGVKQPKGILHYSTALTGDETRPFETLQHVMSGAATTITADALNNLIYSLNPAYRQNGKFVMSTTTLGLVRNLKDKNDRYLFDDTTGKLKGFEVVEANDCPEVAADALAVLFGDFQAAYQIVDRTMTILRDPFSSKPYVLFYGRKRVSGSLVDSNAIKVLKIGL